MNFKFLKYLTTAITIYIIFGALQAQAKSCPTSPTKVSPKVNVEIKFDKQTKLYQYIYTLENKSESLLPMDTFILLINTAPVKVEAPKGWYQRYKTSIRMHNYQLFDSFKTKIQIGKSIKGFEIKSSNPPGIIKYAAAGVHHIPTSTPTKTDDEPVPDCPDYYFTKPRFESLVMGATIGPVAVNQISTDILIQKTKKSSEQIPYIHPLASGKVEVVLFENNNFKLKRP